METRGLPKPRSPCNAVHNGGEEEREEEEREGGREGVQREEGEWTGISAKS